MKLEPLSEDIVERALGKLGLEFFRDERDLLNLQMPNARTLFVFGEGLLTLRTLWNGTIAEQDQARAVELLNNINAQTPTGRVIPVINIEDDPAVEFREHYFLNPGVDVGQLVLIFDAYFSIMTSIFDELESVFPAVDEGES